MNETDTILQRKSKSGASECGWHLLSPSLLQKARSRVRVIAWLMLGIMSTGALIDISFFFVVEGELDPLLVTSSVFMLAMSAALLLASYSSKLPHVTVLHLALGYEVVACAFMATLMPWFMLESTGQYPYVTWVTPLIIMFPLIVPSPPRVTLVTALLAAATRPLGLALLAAVTSMELDAGMVLMSSMSPAFAVAIAYAGSRVVHGMHVDLAKAQRMGSYQLESRLGTGGMGEVWLAKHQFLARPAAIKLINPATLAQKAELQRVALARFEREAQATAAMRSPHTIQLYDFGIAQSGVFYYVMEYLDGLDLDELVRRYGPLPPSRLVFLLVQVCDSLGEAHERGLIHRDVKPANIYVCRHGRSDDFVKVLDFGLVKSEREEEDNVGLTADGTVGGTPAFVAPEQIVGDKTDGRADIYSLGCTAYWALTGAYVFEGGSTMATIMMHVNTTPSPPSACGVQPIPAGLDEIVLACLEKDPANRPQTTDELAEKLNACEVGSAWSRHRAREWWETSAAAAT
jgi:tRNA A-37 threonylcarbamoyl transferase component Bud32